MTKNKNNLHFAKDMNNPKSSSLWQKFIIIFPKKLIITHSPITKSHRLPQLLSLTSPEKNSHPSHSLRVSPSSSEFLSQKSTPPLQFIFLSPPEKKLSPLSVLPSFSQSFRVSLSPLPPHPHPPSPFLRPLGVSPRFSCKSLLILNHLKNKLKKS